MKKSWLVFFALGVSASSMAMQTFEDSFKVSDVVGKFAEIGYVGPYANTKTVNEAHLACMSTMSVGSESASSNISSFSDAYKTCMSQYVPFKKAGSGESNACAMETVSWGECRGVAQATPDGTSVSIKNTIGEFEGYATFQCSGGALTYQSGGCAKVVNACESGKIAQWPVTSPLWADPSSATVYVDKYGQFRNTPKPQCQARMGEAPSGKLEFPQPTAAELYDPARYDIQASSSPQRCFNNDWIHEPGAGTSSCNYVPKSCAAKSVNYNGCGFSLPAGAHDSVFVAQNPTPFNSVGSMEAYCWDGEWEVKSNSCQLSCEQNIAANQWKGSDPKSCAHPASTQSQRIRPGLNVLLSNETPGMNGNISYLCDNGTLKSTSSTCEPKSCTFIKAQTWGDACSHEEIRGNTWQHGQTVTISSYTDIFVAAGSATYQCIYGGLSSAEDGSMDMVGSPECGGSGEPICKNDPSNPPSTCSGGVLMNGICCSRSADGSVNCGTVNPPAPESQKSYGPWSDWVNVGEVFGCNEWTPDASTVPEGQLFTAQRTCKQNQERDRDIFLQWSDGRKEKIDTEKESRVIDAPEQESRTGEKVNNVTWTSQLTFGQERWDDTTQVHGELNFSGDLIVLSIGGVKAKQSNTGYLSWDSGACPTCFVSEVKILNVLDEFKKPEIVVKKNMYSGSSGLGVRSLYRDEDRYRGRVTVDLRITITDALGNSANVDVGGVEGVYEIACFAYHPGC